MEQKKIGLFLKELREEKNLTQEALAEKLNVSGRTVSRWETGNNMPDISLLVELSEFYQVSIPEIIDGIILVTGIYFRLYYSFTISSGA